MIYCPNGQPPFTREHVIPRGLGGGLIFPAASCETCREIIRDIETYCMRGPFLSRRLHADLVNDPEDLGPTIRMPIAVDGVRREKVFPVDQYPKFLVLPVFHDPPGLLTGRANHAGRISFSVWGDENELEALHREGNAILVEDYNLDKFGRALAKMAHGFIAGEWGLDNFEHALPDYILGKYPQRGDTLIGNWGEDGMARPVGLLHQIGQAFVEEKGRVRIDVRLRLFADHENTPVYRVIAGYLTKPIDDVLARRGWQSRPDV